MTMPHPATPHSASRAARAALELPHFDPTDHLSPACRSALAGIGQSRTRPEGQALLRAGDVARSVLMLKSGRMRVIGVSQAGAEVQRPSPPPGKLIGLYSVLGDLPFHFSVFTATPCEVIHFDKARLRSLMRDSGDIAMEFAELLARRTWSLMNQTVERELASTAYRLHETLLQLARTSGVRSPSGTKVTISQSDLAALVGSSRPHVNTCLRELQDEGLVKLGYRSIVVHEFENAPA